MPAPYLRFHEDVLFDRGRGIERFFDGRLNFATRERVEHVVLHSKPRHRTAGTAHGEHGDGDDHGALEGTPAAATHRRAPQCRLPSAPARIGAADGAEMGAPGALRRARPKTVPIALADRHQRPPPFSTGFLPTPNTFFARSSPSRYLSFVSALVTLAVPWLRTSTTLSGLPSTVMPPSKN